MCVRKDIGFELKEFLQLVGGEVTSHVFAGINLHKKEFYFFIFILNIHSQCRKRGPSCASDAGTSFLLSNRSEFQFSISISFGKKLMKNKLDIEIRIVIQIQIFLSSMIRKFNKSKKYISKPTASSL